MIKNPSKSLSERIEVGDNFFMLSEEYLSKLDILPPDVLRNMVIGLSDKNRQLKDEIKFLKGVIKNEFITHGR